MRMFGLATLLRTRPHRRRPLVAWLLIALISTMGVVLGTPAVAAPKPRPEAWRAAPVASPRASEQACADYLFVGVRGSGEPAGYGGTVTGVKDGLAKRWTGGTVRQVWLDYPAADPHTLAKVPIEKLIFDRPMPATAYFGSADTGATALTSLLKDSLERCPGERTIMAGFSQGAQVITQTLSRTPRAVDRLAGAVLLGNPYHYPSQSVRELSGNAPASAIGLGALLELMRHRAGEGAATSREQAVKNLLTTLIALHEGTLDDATVRAAVAGTGAEIPTGAYPHTYSVCQSGDLVCDAGPPMTDVLVQNSTVDAEFNKTRPIHLGYTPALLAATLDQLAKDIAALPPIAQPAPSSQPAPAASNATLRTLAWVAGAGVLIAVVVGYLGGRWHSAARTRRTGATVAVITRRGRRRWALHESPDEPEPER